ncbi:succinate dehydrogenase hydrophobic membrane anchor subunit [Microbacterium sp.]|uniref:succinate dehydrogenase hydrophobic membrane anchor subunit n=1 Tax=Microbacterium sp. TaxID=51671 RepID=UPI003A952C46
MTADTVAAPRSPHGAPAPRRRGVNLEKWGWMFMRASGVLLIVLIFGHLFVNLILGEGVRQIDFAFVAGKYATPFWQWWDVIMLWLALIHGTNGMRTIVNDYVGHNGTRRTLIWALWLVAAFLILLGTLVVFTFDPCIPPVPSGLAGVCAA